MPRENLISPKMTYFITVDLIEPLFVTLIALP